MGTPSPHFHEIGLGARVRDKARDMDRVRTSSNFTKGSLISWGSPKFYDTGNQTSNINRTSNRYFG